MCRLVGVGTIYLASDYGFTEAGSHFLETSLLPGLRGCGIRVLDPWRAKEDTARRLASMGDDPVQMRALNAELAAANAADIRSSDAVVACMDGYDVDSGVAAEVGYAFALGKVIYGLRADVRPGGENAAARVNLQVQYFVEASGGSIYGTVVDLLAALRRDIGDAGRHSPQDA